ncbi:AAA family ATPase [Streptomyces sp. NPDC058691]|uniref:AAA family ATPase n=1 Tax=Streptomyces sp. NPDC058691 TaxID=3346601 RepID=UPI003649ACBD
MDAIGTLIERLRGELATDTSGPEAGASERTLLLLGEPGIGKTSLLEVAAKQLKGQGGQARWVVGRPEEAGLAFSGLATLLHPWRDISASLDAEDRALLETALRGEGAPAGGTLALAGALLRVLSQWADAGPVLVVVDDLQWLDQSTQDLLSLCARRLQGEPVGFLLASRPDGLPPGWTRQSTLHRLEDLDDVHAAHLLDSLAVPPQGRTRRQVMRQAGGNPLALVELARAAATRSPDEERSGLELPLTERLEQIFAADLDALPPATRRLLLLAAIADLPDMGALAEVLGDVLLPHPHDPAGDDPAGAAPPVRSGADADRRAQGTRAAEEAWALAEKAGLLALRQGVIQFRHPLVRSAVLSAAPFDQRSQAHRLIASVPALDEDRRAWHRAAATVTADQDVADALEGTAERARRRGGYAAAAMTLERAAQLSPLADDRVRRLNAAAVFASFAGHPRWVAELTSAVAAEAGTADARAEADLYAGWALALTSRHEEAMNRLMAAADGWAATRPDRALDALGTASTVAYTSGEARFREAILRRYRALPSHGADCNTAWILAGCDPLGSRAEALAHLRHAVAARDDKPIMAWALLGAAAWSLDETDTAVRLLGTMLEMYRQAPTAGANATVASAHALALFEAGRWPASLAGVGEADRAAAAGGLELATTSTNILAAALAAVRGDSRRATRTLADVTRDFDLRGTRTFAMRARQTHALASLAEGDHRAAYFHLSRLFHRDGSPLHFHSSFHGLADLAACAVRVDRADEARATLEAAMDQLPATTSPRLHLILCRAQGLLSGDAARSEELLREAAFTPGSDQWPFERALALADLGEWLRRRQRPADARAPLGEALDVFRTLGAAPWVTRTVAELRATGVDPGQELRPDPTMELTPQQLAIVELAAQGLSNKEIAARLFLSPRTVGFHLNRAFPKLGVTSRFQLRDVFA